MKRRSIIIVVNRTFWITLSLFIILVLINNIIIYQRAHADLINERNTELKIVAKDMEGEIRTIHESLQDFISYISLDANLDSGNEFQFYSAKKNSYTNLTTKLAANKNIGCMFLLNRNRNIQFILLKNGYQPEVRSQTYDFISGIAQEDCNSARTNVWNYCEIGKKKFLFQAYHIQQGIVGTLIDLELLCSALKNRGEESSYSIVVDGQNIVSFGETDTVMNKSYTTTLKMKLSHCDVVILGTYSFKLGQYMFNTTFISLLGISLLSLLILLLLKKVIRTMVEDPLKTILTSVYEVEKGNYGYRVPENLKSQEFFHLGQSFNHMVDEVVVLKFNEYEQSMKEKNHQLRQLRAQLQPHFYLNAITTVNTLIYQHREEEICMYLKELSSYIRYMMKIKKDMARLYEEVKHIRGYLKIQEMRSPMPIICYIDVPEELENRELPHLILFTVVENVFRHGFIDNEPIMLFIQCKKTEEKGLSGFSVVVEDSGHGFSQEYISAFYGSGEIDLGDENHIGLENIRETLQLCYERQNLLRISNVEPHGARVEIIIPDQLS